MKLLLKFSIFLLAFFSFSNESFSFTDFQIKRFCKKEKKVSLCIKKLALNINIKTITPAAISTVRGRSSKLIIRLSVKTINGYKAIARKGKTAQEVFISTDLSKDELKQIIDIYNNQ